MISAFEVAAIFRVKDEASASLQRMAMEVKALNDAVKVLVDQGAKLSEIFAGVFTKIDTGISSSIADVRGLAAEWVNVERAAKAAAAASLGAGASLGGAASAVGVNPRQRIAGPHGGGGRGSWHVSSLGAPIPGGHAYFRGGSNAALIGGGALAYGMYEEALLQDAVFKMLYHAAFPYTPENKKRFRDLIQKSASETGFSYHDIAEAATDEIRLLKGTPSKGLDILPEMLRAAATESRLKDTGLKESMAAIIQMAHMTKEYSPEQIKALAPLWGFLSTANPASLPQMARAASYAMPTLQSTLGMDPADVLFETTTLARAGATNSKSGTWVRSAFERALPPDPRLMSAKEYAARMLAMRALGLVDTSGRSTILDPTGTHIDIDKLLTTERSNASRLSLVDRNNFEKLVFGQQGQRGIELMNSPAVLAQTQELKRLYPEFKTQYLNFQEDYKAQSPVQQFRTAWQDVNQVLTDLGQTTLPVATKALQALDNVVKSIAPPLGKPETFGHAVKSGAIQGGGIGAGVGLLAGGQVIEGAGIGSLLGALVGGARWLFGARGSLDNAAGSAAKSVDALTGSIQSLDNAAKGAAKGTSENPIGGAGIFHHMNFIAPARTQAQPIYVTSQLNIDGQTLAESMSTALAAMFAFETQAPYHNGRQAYYGPDMQVTST